MMQRNVWWITGEDGLPLSDGRIVASTYGEADKILFTRIIEGSCPCGSTLIEEAEEEVEPENIIEVSS